MNVGTRLIYIDVLIKKYKISYLESGEIQTTKTYSYGGTADYTFRQKNGVWEYKFNLAKLLLWLPK